MMMGYLRICCPTAWAQSEWVRVVGTGLRAVLHPAEGGLCKMTAEASPGGMGSASWRDGGNGSQLQVGAPLGLIHPSPLPPGSIFNYLKPFQTDGWLRVQPHLRDSLQWLPVGRPLPGTEPRDDLITTVCLVLQFRGPVDGWGPFLMPPFRATQNSTQMISCPVQSPGL